MEEDVPEMQVVQLRLYSVVGYIRWVALTSYQEARKSVHSQLSQPSLPESTLESGHQRGGDLQKIPPSNSFLPSLQWLSITKNIQLQITTSQSWTVPSCSSGILANLRSSSSLEAISIGRLHRN